MRIFTCSLSPIIKAVYHVYFLLFPLYISTFMPQIYDLKRFTQNAYAGSHYQAHLLLQAIDINRRERLSDSCLGNDRYAP